MRELCELGSHCQHLFGFGGIFTDDEFKQVYWNIFLSTMQDWLTHDQNINPFDPAVPLGVDEIANHLQRYWQVYFKNENQMQPSNKRNRNNKRGRGNGNQKSSQTAQNDSKKVKRDKGNKMALVLLTGLTTIVGTMKVIVAVARFRGMTRCVTTGVAAT